MAEVAGILVHVEGPAEPQVVARLGTVDGLRVERRCADLAELLGAARAGIGRVAVLSLGRGVDRPLLAELSRLGVGSVVLAGPEDLHRAGALGAGRVVPDGREVAEGVEAAVLALIADIAPGAPGAPGSEGTARAGSDRHRTAGPVGDRAMSAPPGPRGLVDPGAATAAGPGRLVAVWSAVGSTGRSTVAAALAAEAAGAGIASVLVDADTVAPGVVQLLGVLAEGAALPALCRAAAGGTLDADGLVRRLVRVDPGLELVSGLTRSDRWREIEPESLRVVLESLRARARLVVADVAGGLEPPPSRGADRSGAARTVLAEADEVLVLVPPDPVGVRRAAALLADEPAVGARGRVVLVHTRPVGARAAADAREAIRRFAGVEVLVEIPYDDAVPGALLAGRALPVHAPRSAARQAVRTLAEELLGALPDRRVRVRPRDASRRLTDWVRAPLRASDHR
ncbi:AAA family ATPase [Salana multivorans]|uniref:AAA family ATPase n=1 Tax=Salana multivorans TaxID=120377 RepID=UPI000AF8E451|nr:hypothetical protein [Salana multivorans]